MNRDEAEGGGFKMKNLYGLAENERYRDFPQDPVFYHPELNLIKVWAQFAVLLPEKYGWKKIGEL